MACSFTEKRWAERVKAKKGKTKNCKQDAGGVRKPTAGRSQEAACKACVLAQQAAWQPAHLSSAASTKRSQQGNPWVSRVRALSYCLRKEGGGKHPKEETLPQNSCLTLTYGQAYQKAWMKRPGERLIRQSRIKGHYMLSFIYLFNQVTSWGCFRHSMASIILRPRS